MANLLRATPHVTIPGLLVPQTQDAIWKKYLGTNLAYVAKEGKTTVKEQPMKIKAIMLGLAVVFNLGFSGEYSDMLSIKEYKDKNGVTQYKMGGTIDEVNKVVDSIYFDPYDPATLQSIVKMINYNKSMIVGLLNRQMKGEVLIIVLNKKIKKLQQEVAKLKQAKH